MKKALSVIVALLLLVCVHVTTGVAAAPADSLSIKIGQMVMVGFRGASLAEAPDIAEAITRYHIGGVVLFDYDVPTQSPQRNIRNPQQLQQLTQELQQRAAIPLLIAIDQEGGKVCRLKASRGFPASVSAAHLGALNNPDSTTAAALQTAQTLKAMHVTMNFAPVADVNSNPNNPVIGKYERSFSREPNVVTAALMQTFSSYRYVGIIPTLKHFPGHGSSTTDTHLDFTDVTDTWSPEELEPYRALIAYGYNDAIMTAHVFNAELDPLYPATLSQTTLNGLLRHALGFNGVIISDDMQMKAIADHYGFEKAIQLALEAGVDIVLFGNNVTVYDPAIAAKATAAIRSLVDKKLITPERIEQSYRRIMAIKARYKRVE